jgi:hypothetical protein
MVLKPSDPDPRQPGFEYVALQFIIISPFTNTYKVPALPKQFANTFLFCLDLLSFHLKRFIASGVPLAFVFRP